MYYSGSCFLYPGELGKINKYRLMKQNKCYSCQFTDQGGSTQYLPFKRNWLSPKRAKWDEMFLTCNNNKQNLNNFSTASNSPRESHTRLPASKTKNHIYILKRLDKTNLLKRWHSPTQSHFIYHESNVSLANFGFPNT